MRRWWQLGPRPRGRRILKWAIPVVVAAILGVAAGIGVAAAIHMPRVESLSEFSPARITRLQDRNGEPFASYARQRRVVLSEEEIPDLLRHAVIALEDANFYQHGGFDAKGVLRAALANLRSGRRSEGASTLTMQLARRLFLSPEKVWRRKIEETFLAVELEKKLSKEQILTLYLNIVYFGHGQYGAEAAARFFFGKSVGELDLPEAATLAGIPQYPSKLSPYNAPEDVVRRRNKALERMLEEGYITREEHDAAAAAPLEVVTRHHRDELGPYFAEEVRKYLESTYGTAQLLEGGLAVETTLDPEIQRSAEHGLRQGLKRLDRRKGWRGPHGHLEGDLQGQSLPSWSGDGPEPGRWFEGLVLESNRERALVRVAERTLTLTAEGMAWTGRRAPNRVLERGDVAWFRLGGPEEDGAGSDADGEEAQAEPILYLEQEPQLQGAAVVLESATGAVRAMVGGWDFERNQFNRVTQARRQPGSAFKLFVYGSALEAGWTPADTLYDGPVYFLGSENTLSYSPSNYYSTEYYGILTLRRALEKSINVTAVKLLDLVGVERVIDFARRAGVESDLPPYPSLALGAADLSPLELAAAYASIANQGTYVEPYFIEGVRTPEGRVLEQRVAETRTVTSPEIAYVLTHMLEGVVDRGTGYALADIDTAIAGKTGTTNAYTDAWFAGFTPRYTMLVWVGYDQKRSMGNGWAGDKVAVPLWREIALDGIERGWLELGQEFAPPAGVSTAPVEHLTGLRAAPGAGKVIEEAFVAGTEPVRPYEPEWQRIMELPWYQQRPFYIPKEGERMPEDFTDLEIEEPAG